MIADSFFLLSIPGALLSVLHHFGAEEEEEEEGEEGEAEAETGEAEEDREMGWAPRIAGSLILLAGVLNVLNILF